ncbi:MAG: IPTL-CTERM sorting domain-containing protein [Burkholderiaceae bacterium]
MQTPSFSNPFAGRAPRVNGLSAVALATLALCAGNAVDAQTREQAQAVKQGTNTPALQALAAEFQRKFEADEATVATYLAANPGVQREVVKDGVPHRIVRIGADGQPIYSKSKAGRESARSNVESGQLIKADALYPGGTLGVDITGQSMVVGVWEPGVPRATHELLTGKVTIENGQTGDASVAAQNHATHVTGTIVGKNGLTGNGTSARGLAYSAASRNWDSANDTTEMATAASASMLVSNHSYGYANDNTIPVWQFGAYDNESRSWDLITAAAPFYLPFVAGGNEQQNSGNMGKAGYDLMTGASAAKNVMTVGAVNADKTMSAYSNWGPTDDGRLKPEIVARGTGINSAQAFDAQNQASTTAYSGSGNDSSGTSYASPAAAASALLLQQYHASVNSGRYMKAATLKTLVMGTAEDLGQPGPDFKFGYGLMNTEAAALAIKKNSVVTGNAPADDAACAHGTATKDINCRVAPANSKGALVYEWNANSAADSSSEMSFNVTAKGGTPLVVNLGWSDDGGTEQVLGDGTDPATSRMVYDFDVAVKINGVFTRAWVLPGMANRTDNATKATAFFGANGGPFRQVIVDAPTANALVTIFVQKKTGSPATPRTLSLVVTGLAEAPAATNGACGTAANVATAYIPTANLCTAGTASAVNGGTSSWGWSCTGSNGGTTASCAAPFATTNGGGGAVGAIQATNSNGTTWQIDQANSGFQAMPAPAPAGVTFPSGATRVRLTTGNAGTSATVVLRFSNIPAGAQLYKYGKETGAGDTNKWFPFPATIDRNAGTVTYVLTDGQKGDNDWLANGVIEDPVGLGVGAGGGVEGVPTLSEWALALLAGFMLLVGARQVRRRH